LRRREGLLAASLRASARALEAEQDRWFLWLPVLFAVGILTYFALADEPEPRLAAALVLGSLGLCLAVRHAPLGLCLGEAALAFASGFATAKLRTETVRAPVLAHELRYVKVAGFVEVHELRDKGRARIALRVISLGDLKPEQRPYRVRMTMPAKNASNLGIGEAVTLNAMLQPPPEPIAPGGFDFGRQAWFARLGATGYATSKVASFEEAPATPWDLSAWAQVDAVRAAVNVRIRTALPGETGEIAAALITGERGGISEEVNQAMRDSGLFHVLSISGLHMVIMGNRVLARAGAARPRAGARAALSDQEMGRRCGARRGNLLSGVVGSRRAHGTLVDHDEHRADRGHARPAGAHYAQRRAGGARHSDRRPGVAVRPELRNVVCRGDRARRAL
jgi:competence protein ComEC